MGFEVASKAGVQVTAGQPQDVTIALTLGNVAQQVTVEAASSGSIASALAPMDALLDARSPRTEISTGVYPELYLADGGLRRAGGDVAERGDDEQRRSWTGTEQDQLPWISGWDLSTSTSTAFRSMTRIRRRITRGRSSLRSGLAGSISTAARVRRPPLGLRRSAVRSICSREICRRCRMSAAVLLRIVQHLSL